MSNISISEINGTLAILDRLLPLVDEAERKFKSARNWGFLDILGGGFIVDMIKHYKIDSASSLMKLSSTGTFRKTKNPGIFHRLQDSQGNIFNHCGFCL